MRCPAYPDGSHRPVNTGRSVALSADVMVCVCGHRLLWDTDEWRALAGACLHPDPHPRRSVDRWDEDEVSGRWCPVCGAILKPPPPPDRDGTVEVRGL